MKLNIFKKFIFAGLPICAILCVSNVSAMKRSATWTPNCNGTNYDESDFDNNTKIGDLFALEADGQIYNDDAPLTLDIPSTPNNLNTATTTNNNNYSTGDESHNFVNNETSSNVPKPTQHEAPQQNFDNIFTKGDIDGIIDLGEAPTIVIDPSTVDQTRPSAKLSKKAQLFFEILNQYKTIKKDLNGAEPNYLNDQEELLDILKRSKSLKRASALRNQTYRDLGEIFAKLKSIPQIPKFKPIAWFAKQIPAGINAMLKNNFLEAQNIFLDTLKYSHKGNNENIKISALYHLGRITEILSNSSTTNNNNNSTSTLTNNNNLAPYQTTTPNSTTMAGPTSTPTTEVVQPATGQETSSSTVYTPEDFAGYLDRDFN